MRSSSQSSSETPISQSLERLYWDTAHIPGLSYRSSMPHGLSRASGADVRFIALLVRLRTKPLQKRLEMFLTNLKTASKALEWSKEPACTSCFTLTDAIFDSLPEELRRALGHSMLTWGFSEEADLSQWLADQELERLLWRLILPPMLHRRVNELQHSA